MKAEIFIERMKQGVIALLYLGLFGYALLLGFHAFGWSTPFLQDKSKAAYLVGLPICGVAAFAIVCVLDRFAPATKDSSGKLEFKAFGLTFSGPAGPVTLWIACYLTLVASMRLVGP